MTSCPHAKDRYLLWLDPGSLRQGEWCGDTDVIVLFPAAKHHAGLRLAPS